MATKLSFKAFSSRGCLTQTFFEGCVDFEVAHLSIHASEIVTSRDAFLNGTPMHSFRLTL